MISRTSVNFCVVLFFNVFFLSLILFIICLIYFSVYTKETIGYLAMHGDNDEDLSQ